MSDGPDVMGRLSNHWVLGMISNITVLVSIFTTLLNHSVRTFDAVEPQYKEVPGDWEYVIGFVINKTLLQQIWKSTKIIVLAGLS